MNEFSVCITGLPPCPLGPERPTILLGRAPELDLVLDDPAISRRHARLTWQEGRVWIQDLDSRHGSFLNGRRINGPERVTAQDRILIGQVEVRLQARSGPVDLEATPIALAMADLRLPGGAGVLDLLHGVSLLMLKDLEPREILGDLLDRLFDLLQAARGAVLLMDAEGSLAPLALRSREGREVPPSLSASTLETTLNRRVASLFREPLDPALEGQHGRVSDSGTTSAMVVPLEHDGQVLGLFYFDAGGKRGAFSGEDLRLVATLSNLAAAKMLQARMREELRLQEERERDVRAREQAARAKGDFLARMSHEIRTPLGAVLGFAHLARRSELPAQAGDCLDKIEASGRLLLGVVNDVLDFSRLEAGREVLREVPFDLRAELKTVFDLFALAAADKGLALDLSYQDDPPAALVGDPLRLGQILTNLLGNAVKFTQSGGVQLTVANLGAAGNLCRLAFAVRDTGPGIAPEDVARLFSPFSQVPGTAGGTGLGLAIARSLAERMGGILTVSSEPGRGSAFTFTVSLPVAETVLNRHLAPIPDLAGRRILLVEDNVLNQELVLALLAETGAGTDVAKDGDEALRCLERNPYDAVLMDLQMPGMDGFDTARAIRDRGAQLPILALTAREGALERCLEAGMAGLVAKPIEPRQLLEALAQAVRPAEILDRLAGHMDVAGALDRLGGRMDLLLHFLQRYLEEPIPLETIPAAMALGDRARAGQVAHDLKGFGASLGRVRAARLAGDLEARLLEEGPARWEPLYGELSQVEAEFLAAARVAMGTGAAAPPGG